MNIFILSYHTDWEVHMQAQAHSHCDRHVVKMITESVQMLSTALSDAMPNRAAGIQHITHPPATKAAYGNHPCTKWAAESLHNFTYLAHLARALCKEKQHRYPTKPIHSYELWIAELITHLPKYTRVPALFPIAIPDCLHATKLTGIHVNLDTAADLYQRYYVTHKSEFASWKNRPIPVWYLIEQESYERRKGN